MDTERFCKSGVYYTWDSEDENSEDGTSQHIYFLTDNGNHYDRITRTGRWKIVENCTTYSNPSPNTTIISSSSKTTKVSDSKNLDKMYNEYLNFLASKHPDKKDPIYY
jgi:hypothetical protein